MAGEKTYSLVHSQDGCKSGGVYCMSEAFQSGPATEDYPPLPIGFTGHLVLAEQHPLADVSSGGALGHAPMGGPSTERSLDDYTTTDGELEACIGICSDGRCAGGCR